MQKTNKTILVAVILALCIMLSLAACGEKTPEFQYGSKELLKLSDTDYANPDYWLRFGGDGGKSVDIFAVYPTVTRSMDEADKPFVRIDSPLMRESATDWLERVDGIISPAGNVYAPLYGQLNRVMLAEFTNEEFESYTIANPRDDIFAAFDYYLTHINKGERPFILFGLSQGAALVMELATVFLGNEKYYEHNKNHIVTYAVGNSVTQEKIDRNPNLRFSQSPVDSGVIVSWNTTAPSEIASGTFKTFGTWHPGALVTNPISWTADEVLAHASANRASMVLQPDGSYIRIENYANAVADMEHRVLVTTTVPETDYASGIPTISKFHLFDLMLYYDSIAQNIKDRIQAFSG